MAAERFSLKGSHEGEEIEHPLQEGRTVLGRSRECDLQLSSATVSRRHAEIEVSGDVVTVRDLGSHNGTLVNGQQIAEPTELTAGDMLELAGHSFQLLRVADTPTAPEPVQPATTAQTMLSTEPLLSDQTTIHEDAELSWNEARAEEGERKDRLIRLFPVLAEAGDLLSRGASPEELFEPILDLVETALRPERSFVLLREEGDQELKVKAARLRGNRSHERMILSSTLVGRVIERRSSFLIGDARQDPHLQAQHSIVMQGIRSAMAVPLFDNQEVIGLLYADSSDPTCCYTKDELRAFTLLANVVAVAISNAHYRALEEEKRRLDMQLDTARTILERILPAELPACPGYDLHARLEPCFEVGGDLFDVRCLGEERLALLLGDVTGKGLGSALLVTQILSAARLLIEEDDAPARLMARLSDQLFSSTDHMRFATLFLGLLEPRSGRLTYVNGGHNSPLLLTRTGELVRLGGTGLPVGAFPGVDYEQREAALSSGDLLVLYSDGVTEALDHLEQEYGEERLESVLRRHRDDSAERIIGQLLEDLDAFRGEAMVMDDITVLAVKRL
jgi:sigma-B regulation protein RsbU (phosphoserine phosphatase)